MSSPSRVISSHPPAAVVTPSQPAVIAPVVPVVPTAPIGAARLRTVIVKPGDSLWKIAEQNLGKGVRWHDLLAVNPGIVDANRVVVGSQIYLPEAISSLRTATKITVRKGDTLSKIAQTRFGHASLWSCVAQANPAVRDANVIYEGQVLLLPANCKP